MIQAGHVKIYCIFQLLKISAIILRFLSIDKVGKIERSLANSCNLQLCLLVGCSNIYIYIEIAWFPLVFQNYTHTGVRVCVIGNYPSLKLYQSLETRNLSLLPLIYLREFAKKQTPFAHAPTACCPFGRNSCQRALGQVVRVGFPKVTVIIESVMIRESLDNKAGWKFHDPEIHPSNLPDLPGNNILK